MQAVGWVLSTERSGRKISNRVEKAKTVFCAFWKEVFFGSRLQKAETDVECSSYIVWFWCIKTPRNQHNTSGPKQRPKSGWNSSAADSIKPKGVRKIFLLELKVKQLPEGRRGPVSPWASHLTVTTATGHGWWTANGVGVARQVRRSYKPVFASLSQKSANISDVIADMCICFIFYCYIYKLCVT